MDGIVDGAAKEHNSIFPFLLLLFTRFVDFDRLVEIIVNWMGRATLARAEAPYQRILSIQG